MIMISSNRLKLGHFYARARPANLASKNDIASFVKKTSFGEKLKTITSNKNELNELSKKLKNYQQKD